MLDQQDRQLEPVADRRRSAPPARRPPRGSGRRPARRAAAASGSPPARAPARRASACRRAGPRRGVSATALELEEREQLVGRARAAARSSRRTRGRRSAFARKPLRVRQWPPTMTFSQHAHACGTARGSGRCGRCRARRCRCAASRASERPSNAMSPVAERVEPRQAVEERGLAGAVRADQADDLPARDVERDAVERDDAAEAHRDVGHLEQLRLRCGMRLDRCLLGIAGTMASHRKARARECNRSNPRAGSPSGRDRHACSRARRVASAGDDMRRQCASSQFGPTPTSASSGTCSSATPAMMRGTLGPRPLDLGLGHLEHQFVVHLHDHLRRRAPRVEHVLHRDHRELDQVGRRALHRRVDRLRARRRRGAGRCGELISGRYRRRPNTRLDVAAALGRQRASRPCSA